MRRWRFGVAVIEVEGVSHYEFFLDAPTFHDNSNNNFGARNFRGKRFIACKEVIGKRLSWREGRDAIDPDFTALMESMFYSGFNRAHRRSFLVSKVRSFFMEINNDLSWN